MSSRVNLASEQTKSEWRVKCALEDLQDAPDQAAPDGDDLRFWVGVRNSVLLSLPLWLMLGLAAGAGVLVVRAVFGF